MPSTYLLDTNVVSDFVRGHRAVTSRMHSTSPTQIAISSITVMEIAYGLALSPTVARRVRPAIDALLGAVELVSLSVEDARAAGTLRAALRRTGRPIGPYDVLIAGSALARGLTLVTANLDEFSRVDGLSVETWQRA